MLDMKEDIEYTINNNIDEKIKILIRPLVITFATVGFKRKVLKNKSSTEHVVLCKGRVSHRCPE